MSFINIIFEICCLFAALYYLRKDAKIFSQTTLIYLTVVCIVEIVGLAYTKTIHKSNAWIFNVFIIFEAAYISYGLYVALKGLAKKALVICFLPLIIFSGTYIFEIYKHGFLIFNAITVNVYSVLFVISSLIYFHLLVKQKDPIILKINPQFWWVTGVLFYYFGSTIYNLFVFFLYQHFPKSYSVLIYVMLGLNLLLYSIWIYSFICNSRQQKLLS